MFMLYYTTTANPLCHNCKKFDSYDDAMYFVENANDIKDYYIE